MLKFSKNFNSNLIFYYICKFLFNIFGNLIWPMINMIFNLILYFFNLFDEPFFHIFLKFNKICNFRLKLHELRLILFLVIFNFQSNIWKLSDEMIFKFMTRATKEFLASKAKFILNWMITSILRVRWKKYFILLGWLFCRWTHYMVKSSFFK